MRTYLPSLGMRNVAAARVDAWSRSIAAVFMLVVSMGSDEIRRCVGLRLVVGPRFSSLLRLLPLSPLLPAVNVAVVAIWLSLKLIVDVRSF